MTRSEPRRSKSGEAATRVVTTRSPAGPPARPGSPLPLRRICVPSLTPAGIFTEYRFVRRWRPEPLHVRHGFSTTVPLPPQRGQGREKAKTPSSSEVTPRPRHTGGRGGAAPAPPPPPPQVAQGSSSSTGIFVVRPFSESSK